MTKPRVQYIPLCTLLFLFSVRQASSRRETSRDFASSSEDKEAKKEAEVAGHAEDGATGVTAATEVTGASGETTRVAVTARDGVVEAVVITVASEPSYAGRRSMSKSCVCFSPAPAVHSHDTIVRLLETVVTHVNNVERSLEPKCGLSMWKPFTKRKTWAHMRSGFALFIVNVFLRFAGKVQNVVMDSSCLTVVSSVPDFHCLAPFQFAREWPLSFPLDVFS
jgi:hypothetical protein